MSLGPFRGLLSSAAGDAPAGFAGSLLNVRLGDGAIRPRYGYRNLAGAPTGLRAVHGLVRLSGYGEGYDHRVEWVTIENRGAVRPYAVDPATWARTEITSAGTPLSLGGGDWLGFSYNGASYFVNPGGSPSVFRHAVGDAASWEPLQDAAYAPQPEDPTFAADLLPPTAYPFGLAGDAATVSGPGVASPTTATNADGSLTVSGRAGNDSQETASSIVTLAFGTPQDFSTTDYHGFLAQGEDVYIRFKTGVQLDVKIGGAWSTPPQKAFLSDDRTRTGVVVRLKDVAGKNAVQAVRLTLRAEPQPHHAGKAYTILPYQIGGSYLGATTVGDRPWDAAYKTADVAYAARYLNVAAGTSTGIKTARKDRSVFGRYDLDASLPFSTLGDRITLSVEPLKTGGYADDPSGASYRIEYLRLDGNGTWRTLGTTPNTADASFRDRYEEREVLLLPAATGVGDYVPPENPPVFSSDGFVAGVPYKGWVVWLKKGGEANVIHSRVGDAEALYSPGDTDDQEGRGANFTLADDFADEPLGAVQAGDAILIVGREGVYGQSGNSPATMTPTRKLPGAMGCAGRFAFARYRDEAGNYGIAWLDVPGEAVWFASAALLYASDAQARPTEISLPIRGSVRSFLYEEQRAPLLLASLARNTADDTATTDTTATDKDETDDGTGTTDGPGGGTGGGSGGGTGGGTGGTGGGTGGSGGGTGGTGGAGGTGGSGSGGEDTGGSPALALENARLDVDEATGSLWVVLGRRALVLRPPSPLDGQRHWERHEYATGSDGADLAVCADPFGPTVGSSEARTGATLGDWGAPEGVRTDPGYASRAGFLPGSKSRWLRASALTPGTGLPAEAALASLKLRVRHRWTPATGSPTPVLLAAVEVSVAGEVRTTLSPGLAPPREFGDADLTLDFAALGIGVAELNAGAVTVRLAYDAIPGDPSANVPENWGFDYTYTGTTTLTGSGYTASYVWPSSVVYSQPGATDSTVTSRGTIAVTPRWLLSTPAPPSVAVAVTAKGEGQGLNTTGPSASSANGFGDPPVETASPYGRTSKSEGVHVVTMVPDTPYSISGMSGVGHTGGYGPGGVPYVYGGCLVSAAVVAPTSATVDVESVTLVACYALPQAEGARSIAYLAFGPDRNLLWLRSSGHLDSAEWCPSCARSVEGSGRDGGLPMPVGHWETGRLAGGLRRLARAEIEREGYGALALAATTDRAPSPVAAAAPSGQRWARWGVALQGRTHRVRLVVDESTVGIRAVDLVFQPVSGPNR